MKSLQGSLTIWKNVDYLTNELPGQVFPQTELISMNLKLKTDFPDPHPTRPSWTINEPEYRVILKTRSLCHPLKAIRDYHLNWMIKEELLWHDVCHNNDHWHLWEIPENTQAPSQIYQPKMLSPSSLTSLKAHCASSLFTRMWRRADTVEPLNK